MMLKAVLFATLAVVTVWATAVPYDDDPEEQSDSYSYASASSTGSSYATGSSSDTGSSYSSGYSSSSSSSSGGGSSYSSSSSYSSNSGSRPPRKPKCKAHEIFNDCINGGCSPRKCSQLGFPVPCIKIDPKYCKKGCICEDEYVRNDKGVCIPKKKCPSCGGDPNAVASICGNNCKNTCANYKKDNVFCPKLCRVNGCECKKGYVYDDNRKKCVLPEDCTPVCKANEEYSDCVNGGCFFRTCDNIGKKLLCPKIDPKYCKGGCRCKSKYVYDTKNKKCVLPEDCPGRCTKKHEVYSDCINGGCDAKTCAQNGIKIPCVDYNSTACIKGCMCEDGYLRADDGTCIPRNDCPSCGGDPNAQQGCGINCGRHCSNYMLKNVPCPLRPCFINNCDCRPQYVFDDNLQICVLPENCTPACKENEVFSRCINSCGAIKWCDQINAPRMFCPAIPATNCKGGCVCIDGYLRNSQGVCIPRDQCPEATSSTNQTSGYDCTEALQRLRDGNLKFTVDFLADLVATSPTTSTITSPFSVFIPLGIFSLFTGQSDSFDQIMSVLNLRNKDEIRCVFKEVLKTYESQDEFKLQLANKVYVSINSKLTERFKTDTQQVFNAEGEALDFNNNQLAADTINSWVAGKTNNLITDLVSPSMFNTFTRLALVNAIYFLGSWVTQFSPDNTSDRDFYVSATVTKPVPTMFLSNSFRYAEVPSLDAKILEIPYKGGKINYVAILPNANDGLADLVNKLKDTAVLNDALNQLQYQKVNLYLPRYETSTTIDLTAVLKHLGITDLFDASKSNLSDIIEGPESLGVTSAVQKAKIKVDEVGTEAAAANTFVVGTTSVQIIKEFNANHPFAYFIFRESSPLFAGVVAGD